MGIISIAQRIERIVNEDGTLIHKNDCLELLTTLRKLGVVSKQDMNSYENNPHLPNHSVFQVIWEALTFGVSKGKFVFVTCDDSTDVILSKCLLIKAQSGTYENMLDDQPRMWGNTRGVKHLLEYDSYM